jgi:DNA mismatch endonuclease (patch repair protein)
MPKKYEPKDTLRLTAREGFVIEVDDETSVRMANIGQRDTKPEMIVRKILQALGHRYRVDNGDLPGRPDIANRKRRWVIFVHGCYWHHHEGCRLATVPTRNRDFWMAKFMRNRARDATRAGECAANGYRVVTVWECETRSPTTLASRLREELPS